jgi:hypothetical protein
MSRLPELRSDGKLKHAPPNCTNGRHVCPLIPYYGTGERESATRKVDSQG